MSNEKYSDKRRDEFFKTQRQLCNDPKVTPEIRRNEIDLLNNIWRRSSYEHES